MCSFTLRACDGELEALLMSTDPSAENICKLREHLAKTAPQAMALFDEDDFADYFSKAEFTGAVVRCAPRLNPIGELALLVGDSAHSVIPSTGEGLNSGLEDASVLADCFLDSPRAPFAAFNERRWPDIVRLGDYAEWMLLNLSTPGREGKRRQVAEVILRIALAILKLLRVVKWTVDDYLFGKANVIRDGYPLAYRELFGPWDRHLVIWKGAVIFLRVLDALGGALFVGCVLLLIACYGVWTNTV